MCVFKKLVLAAGLLGAGAVVLFGTKVGAYGRAAYSWAHRSISSQVPVELDISAAKQMLTDLDRKIEKAIRAVSHEKVEVAQLEKQSAGREENLKNTREKIVSMRQAIETNLATDRPGKAEMRKAELATLFASYEHQETVHQTALATLDSRRAQYAAAELKATNLQKERAELSGRIERLEAKQKMLEASKVADKVQFDESEIADIKNLVNSIEQKLDEEQDFQTRKDQFSGSTTPAPAKTENSKDLLEKIDRKFPKDAGKAKGTSL
jgi:hypothetical protein